MNRTSMTKFGQVEMNYISHSRHLIQCGFKNPWAKGTSPVSYLILSTFSTISIGDNNNSNAFTL